MLVLQPAWLLAVLVWQGFEECQGRLPPASAVGKVCDEAAAPAGEGADSKLQHHCADLRGFYKQPQNNGHKSGLQCPCGAVATAGFGVDQTRCQKCVAD